MAEIIKRSTRQRLIFHRRVTAAPTVINAMIARIFKDETTKRLPYVITAAMVVMLLVTGPASAQDCYQSSILSPSPFMGNNDEIFKLGDGSLWQVKYEYEYLYEYYPLVIICPSRGKLIVDKKSLNVQLVSGGSGTKLAAPKSDTWVLFEETSLQGSVSGTVQQGRIFKTVSGNIYEIVGLTLQLVLELQPEVMVLRRGDTYKLIVEGFDEPLICRKLN